MRNVVGNRYPGLTPEDLATVAVVSGHSLSTGMRALFPGAEIRQSVLIRDPLGYLLSFYNYRWTRHAEGWGNQPPAFETWYRAQRRNPISRFLLNRYFEQGVPAIYRLSSAGRLAFLEARLAGFHFVGSYRRAAELIGTISREIGIDDTVENRNVTPTKTLTAKDIDPALRTRIAAENALDQALWERWGDRGWGPGSPGTPARAAGFDQGRYLMGDISSGLLKKIIR